VTREFQRVAEFQPTSPESGLALTEQYSLFEAAT
jgi:hypothetical protein